MNRIAYELDRDFGQHLRALRMGRKWTQGQMTAKLQLIGYDTTRGALAKMESGTRHIYLDDLLALKQVLNISFDELLLF